MLNLHRDTVSQWYKEHAMTDLQLPNNGFFVTFEGIDGCGKSTQAKRLHAALEERGYRVTRTREPGGTEGAEEIRHLLVTGEPGRWGDVTETMLFYAARRDHCERLILPALEAGAVVICDRFADSSRAYQGQRGVPQRAFVDALHQLAVSIEPHLTIVLDLDPKEAVARADARTEQLVLGESAEDRYERMGLQHKIDLREQYRALAREHADRVVLVSADGDEDAVFERVWSVVGSRLPNMSS